MALRFNFNLSGAQNSASTAGGIGGIIFALFWIGFSSIFVTLGIGTAWKSLGQAAWRKVPCVIDEFKILDDPNQDKPFTAKVTFRYEAGGRERTGHHLYLSNKNAAASDADPAETREAEYHKLAALQRRYLTNRSSVCLVDPGNPGTAALMVKRDAIWGSLAFGGFGLCFVGIGVGLLLQSISQLRAGRDGQAAMAAVTGRRSQDNRMPLLLGLPFFGLFAAAGCGMFCFISVPIVKSLVTAPSLVATPATVIWSRVTSHSDSDGTSHKADVFYRYTFDGKEYKSNRDSMFPASSSSRAGKDAVVRANPQGQAITCYVNPDKPWEAVRARTPGWSALFGLFPLPFMAVGLGGLWFMFRKRKPSVQGALTGHAGRPRSNKSDRVATPLSGFSNNPAASMPGGPLQLKPGKGRVLRFLGMVFVAAFWNGIVSVFLFVLAREWHSGHVPWFLMLFLTPFVLVGVGLLAAVVHAFGAIFNPRPLLEIQPGQVRIGHPLTVSWRIPSGASRLENLRIILRGEEVATYRRGTNTATDRSTFHEAVLFETTIAAMMATGNASVTLPDNLMPSWKASNNRIEWTLHIQGRIRFWPDLADSHIITIQS